MNKFSTLLRRTSACLFGTICFVILLAPAVAMAKDEPAAAAGGSSFFLSYILVGLCIVLGVIAVVRPTKHMENDSDT